MFLKVKPADKDSFPKIVTINTDQIIYYFGFTKDTTMIHFSDNTGLKAYITEEQVKEHFKTYQNVFHTEMPQINWQFKQEKKPGKKELEYEGEG